MARQRLVKPDVFQHEGLHQVEATSGLPLVRAFIGLWCQVDLRGCFEWKPARLKLHVCPFDQLDFADVLNALEGAGFIRSYVVGERKFGVIPSFSRHQTFHHREKPDALIPDPPKAPDSPGAGPGLAPGQPRASPTVSGTVSGTGIGKGLPRPRSQKAATAPPGINWPDRFCELWVRKVGAMTPGRIGKALKPCVDLHGHDRVFAALDDWIDVRQRQPSTRQLRVEWFAEQAAKYIKLADQPLTEDGLLTKRGEMMMGTVP